MSSNFKNFTKFKKNLDTKKNKYKNYLNYQLNNIRKDFQQKILAKQNEMQSIQKIFEIQLQNNEEVLKTENEFTNKISKMNEEFVNKIKILQERNHIIEEERKSVMKNFSVLEENTKKEFSKIIENKSDENVLDESVNFKSKEYIPITNTNIIIDSSNSKIKNLNNLNLDKINKEKENESNIKKITISSDKKIKKEFINDYVKDKSENLNLNKISEEKNLQNSENSNHKKSKSKSKEDNISSISKQSEQPSISHKRINKTGILGAMRRKRQEADKEEKKSVTNSIRNENEINIITNSHDISNKSNNNNISNQIQENFNKKNRRIFF